MPLRPKDMLLRPVVRRAIVVSSVRASVDLDDLVRSHCGSSRFMPSSSRQLLLEAACRRGRARAFLGMTSFAPPRQLFRAVTSALVRQLNVAAKEKLLHEALAHWAHFYLNSSWAAWFDDPGLPPGALGPS